MVSFFEQYFLHVIILKLLHFFI